VVRNRQKVFVGGTAYNFLNVYRPARLLPDERGISLSQMNDPVLRLERTPDAITYRAFDANSIMGSQIRDALMMGFKLKPPATFSSISDLGRATWWRFI